MRNKSWDKRRGAPRKLYDEAYKTIYDLIEYNRVFPHMSKDRIVGIIQEAFQDARKENSMSKQSEAKEAQGYSSKPGFPMCGNCKFFTSEMDVRPGYYGPRTEEKNKRCSLGNFAVIRAATCKKHGFAV